MKVLFIGGTGVISSACAQAVVNKGYELYLLTRGYSGRTAPKDAHILTGDIRDSASVKSVLGDLSFDAVVNWVAFTPEHIETDLDLFQNRTRQYIFISSASVYQTPPTTLPITESTPLYNPFWTYSQNKIACEGRLVDAYRQTGFPVTIVRPSHTYDRTLIPLHGRYTMVARMREGKPIIVHGDGSSIWVLTHHRDFARGFIGLIGNPHAIGDSFHITSDEVLTWDQIAHSLARAAGVEADIVHIPSDLIAAYDPEWGASLLGDKTHSVWFDNTKMKRVVPGYQAQIPFSDGAREIIDWYDQNPDQKDVDLKLNSLIDDLTAVYKGIWPS
jgi:nucleoside-diphosphate-sugar epimerase